MKKVIYVVIGMGLMFAGTALAKVVTVPDVLQRVEELGQSKGIYYSVSKIYDSNANVACYEISGQGGLSCVKL